jgi:hypothetical protein
MSKTPRTIRLLIVCVVAAFAFPAAAGATFQAGSPPTAIRAENGPGRTQAQRQPSAAPLTQIIRNETTNTLPVVLAGLALGVAIGGAGYVTVRLRSLTPRSQ